MAADWEGFAQEFVKHGEPKAAIVFVLTEAPDGTRYFETNTGGAEGAVNELADKVREIAVTGRYPNVVSSSDQTLDD